MFGFATCLLFTATILLSRRVQRHKSVPNFFALLAFSAFMQNLTWFTGHVNVFETKKPPPFGLCLFQSSMISGISTGQGISAFFLVFQVSFNAMCMTSGTSSDQRFLHSSLGKGVGGDFTDVLFQQIGILLRLYGELPMPMDSMYTAATPQLIKLIQIPRIAVRRSMGRLAVISPSNYHRASCVYCRYENSKFKIIAAHRLVKWILAPSGPILCTALPLISNCKFK
jgi:hypothetical protein